VEQALPDLTGQEAIVLGANNAAAAAVALALARAGADVAVTSTSGDPEEAFALRPLRRAIEAEGSQAIADIADLGNGASVQIAVRQIAKQLGRIDVAVVATAVSSDKPVERMTDAEWSRAIAFSLGAYFYACRALAKEFEGNEPTRGIKGRIVALLPAVEPGPGSAVRLAGRTGAGALVEALGKEWASAGIVVNAISLEPGAVEDAVAAAAVRLAVASVEETGRVIVIDG
jgi:NAD(P)-dependent dehydrogenase (short-subunit alcohol dehydrogenase family)